MGEIWLLDQREPLAYNCKEERDWFVALGESPPETEPDPVFKLLAKCWEAHGYDLTRHPREQLTCDYVEPYNIYYVRGLQETGNAYWRKLCFDEQKLMPVIRGPIVLACSAPFDPKHLAERVHAHFMATLPDAGKPVGDDGRLGTK